MHIFELFSFNSSLDDCDLSNIEDIADTDTDDDDDDDDDDNNNDW